MASSFAVSLLLLILKRCHCWEPGTHVALIVTIAATTAVWVATAFLGPQTDREALIAFYRKVRPFGPGWEPIRKAAGVSKEAAAANENIPLALAGWTAGCVAIWSSLFAVGSFLYGRTTAAVLLAAVFVISGVTLLRVNAKLWGGRGGR